MDFDSKPACWGTATWTLAAFAAAIVLTYLFGGFDSSVAVASHAGVVQ